MTLYGTTPIMVDSSIPELYAKQVLRHTLRNGFWTRFIGGEGSGAAIIQKTDLLNNAGDTIHINVTSPLTGSGVSGDTGELIGNEETLATDTFKLIPSEKRHAVRVNRRAQKKSIVDLRAEAKMRLGEWGMSKLDTQRFAAFVSSTALHGETYTPNLRIVGGGTGVDDIAIGDTLDVATLMKAKLDLYNNLALPINMDGEEMFVAVVHHNSLYDLKRSSEYRDWVREAAERGANNPFFKGATAIIDGVVIFQHSRVPTVTNGGGQAVSKNLVFGAEAFLEALDENVMWDEDTFDYGKEWGVAYTYSCEPRRGLEKNSLQLLAAANTPS